MKKILTCLLFAIVLTGAFLLYYFIPRNVPFVLEKEMEKPSKEFDYHYCMGFYEADCKERLMFWLTKKMKESSYSHGKAYDSTFVDSIAKDFDFEKYDYLITYQKKLLKLQHSPHLTNTGDDLYFDKRIPLFPMWDTTYTDSIYIYRINSKRKYRSFGP